MAGIGTIVALVKAMAPKADPAVIQQAVEDYLEAHPEISVADGSITEEKLAADVAGILDDLQDDVTDVKTAIHGVEGEIGTFNITWTADKAIKSSDGNNTSQSNYSASDFIPLYGTKVYVKSFISLSTRAVVAFYDLNKNYLSGIVRESSDTFEKTMNVPANARYIRVTCKTDKIETVFSYKCLNFINVENEIIDLDKRNRVNVSRIDNTNNRIDNLLDNEEYVKYEVGYYNTSGNKQDSTIRARSTELIHLLKGTICEVDSEYMYRLMRYSENDISSYQEYYQYDYDSTYHWITGQFIIPVTGYYGVNVSKRDESAVTDAEITGHKLHIMPVSAVNELKENVSQNIATYNLAGIKEYINAVSEMGGDLVIPVVTDIHGGYPDTYDVINYLANSGIGEYMFELGDVIKATYPTRAESISYLRDSFRHMGYTQTNTPIIKLQGNHDANPLSSSVDETKNVTQEIFYTISGARSLIGKGINQQTGKAYGYIDIENPKVRIIFLNTSDIFDESTGEALVSANYTMIQQGQIDWIQNNALNFTDKEDPSEWSVIIMTHDSLSQISSPLFSALLTAFKTGATASGNYNLTVSNYSYTLTLDCDFTQQGAIDVCCEVNGHHHKDMIKELGSTGIYQVYVACEGPASASYDDDGQTVYYNRQRGTTDEHLIDTLVLDKTNRKVYFKRFGIGNDRVVSY